jgi:transcriptional antiterminator Rof (Rho-off)
MPPINSIDLHPDQVPGQGPEAAIRAARAFLDRALKAGLREVRLITGLGSRGDGTPRLRSRIEQDVLPAYFRHIEQQSYEQGGAVIKLWLKGGAQQPSAAHAKHERKKTERQAVAVREERLEIAYQRLEAAEDFFEENDLKRVRLKLNQVARDLGWDVKEGAFDGEEEASAALDEAWKKLKALDV